MIPMSVKGFRSAPSTIRAWTPSRAVVEPSEDEEIKQCYFFATAYIDEVPHYFYSKTYAQHKKTCEKYGIGIHAKS